MSTDLTMDCATVRELAPEYVLGTLDAATAARLRDHLATCPEAHAELREIAGVVPYLAESLEPVEPRLELRARLLEAARTARPHMVVPDRTAASTSRPVEPRAVAQHAVAQRAGLSWLPPQRFAWALAAAALIVAAALGATTLSLRNQLDDSQHASAMLARAIADAARPGALVAQLHGSEQAPGVSGLAVITGDGGIFVLEGLPPAPAGHYYEAWYIAGGTPTSAGTVSLQADGTGLLSGPDASRPVQQVAVTLEPVGGTAGPDGPFFATGSLTTNPG